MELAFEVAGPDGGVGGEDALLGEYDDPPAGSFEGEEVGGRDLVGEYDAEEALFDRQGQPDQASAGGDESTR